MPTSWPDHYFSARSGHGSYGTPNSTRRCSVAQCYDNTLAILAQSKLGWYCQLVATTHIIVIILLRETKLYGTINNYVGPGIYSLN